MLTTCRLFVKLLPSNTAVIDMPSDGQRIIDRTLKGLHVSSNSNGVFRIDSILMSDALRLGLHEEDLHFNSRRVLRYPFQHGYPSPSPKANGGRQRGAILEGGLGATANSSQVPLHL